MVEAKRSDKGSAAPVDKALQKQMDAGFCQPRGPATRQRSRWQWTVSQLMPGELVAEYEYELPERNPIQCAMKVYDRPHDAARFDMHDALECGFVVRGRVVRYWGTQRQRRVLGPGDVWFCPSYEPNGYELVKTPAQVVVFEIRPQTITDLAFAEAPGVDWLYPFSGPWNRRPRRARDVNALMALARRIELELEQQGAWRPLRIKLLLIEFLLLCMPGRRAGRRPALSNLPAQMRPALDMALGARRRLSNAEAAAACGLSVDAFTRGFRIIMGLSFAKYALRHRLQGAANELATTDHPCKAVARDWGFVDESHLNHLFRRYRGCAPAAYRRKRGTATG